MGCFTETLETRCLLSWPDASFSGPAFENIIYVNQFGDASITGKSISPAGDFDGYKLLFDAPGELEVGVNGRASTALGFYNGEGQPTETTTDRTIGGLFPADKTPVYLGVQGRDSRDTGSYGLEVNGPTSSYIANIKIGARTFAGSSGSHIDGPNDIDFFKFTPTRSGQWSVTVIPDSTLDATINVYDSDGNPIGGSFIKSINQRKRGATETWLSRPLAKGETIYVRVGGNGTEGGCEVLAHLGPPPVVNIVASDATASESGDTARFTVTRSGATSRAFPLTVYYTLSGTARRDRDFQRLSGWVTIPAGKSSASIVITPVAIAASNGVRTLTLSLRSDASYALGAQKSGVIQIVDGVN